MILIYNSIIGFTAHHYPPRTHAHNTDLSARLVGCEGWLGLDGRPLSLHRPYGVTHTRCVPPPPSDQFHRNRLTMSDVFIRAPRLLARTLATLRESYTICLASQETFVTIIGAMTTLSSLLQWHVHLSPPWYNVRAST